MKLFEWDESELCIPRKCISSAAVMSADIESVHELTNTKEIVDFVRKKFLVFNFCLQSSQMKLNIGIQK